MERRGHSDIRRRLLSLAAAGALALAGAAGLRAGAGAETVYRENDWNFVDGMLNAAQGIPEDASAVSGSVLARRAHEHVDSGIGTSELEGQGVDAEGLLPSLCGLGCCIRGVRQGVVRELEILLTGHHVDGLLQEPFNGFVFTHSGSIV
jgi:hypothetical protein